VLFQEIGDEDLLAVLQRFLFRQELLKKVKLRGMPKVDWLFVFSCAAFNLFRIPKLRQQCA
jgi:hypothetical protein